VEHLLRDVKDVTISTLATDVAGKLQALQGLRSRLLEIQSYLEAVLEGKLPVNNDIMFYLQVGGLPGALPGRAAWLPALGCSVPPPPPPCRALERGGARLAAQLQGFGAQYAARIGTGRIGAAHAQCTSSPWRSPSSATR
jgi:hypothetical protein